MKICVVGAFGFDMIEKTTGGQPAKTRQLFYTLSEHYGSENVSYIETYGWKSHPVQMLSAVFYQAKKCDAMIMLPAHNGVQIFARLLSFCKKKYGIKIFYDVIGGWLPEKTRKDTGLSKHLKRFDGIWVETNRMKVSLESQEFRNIAIVPNFRKMKVLAFSEMIFHQSNPLRVCTFSRVMQEKGIGEAISAIRNINESLRQNVFSLDIYGPIAPEYEEHFEKLKEISPEYINYCGVVNSGESTEILKQYFLLLFPTYYHGEGFAGTILDALAAGVPIVASDWKYNPEIITSDVGYLFPTHNQQKFEELLLHIVQKPEEVLAKKIACVTKAHKYTDQKVCADIVRYIEGKISLQGG